MQYIDLEIHALTPAVAPSPAASTLFGYKNKK
jgi:hypothetical protein